MLLDLDEDLREPAYVGRVGLQQVEGDALGALRADAGQPAELVDQVLDDAFVHQKPTGRRATAGPAATGVAAAERAAQAAGERTERLGGQRSALALASR